MTESSQKCPTTRQSFVEAMRLFYRHAVAMGADPHGVVYSWVRQAAEAFADATHGETACDSDCKRSWRASILKEIFGE